jgi:hypothetical protein
MLVDDPVNDRQSKPGSLWPGREVRIKQPSQLLRRHADAGVPDGDYHQVRSLAVRRLLPGRLGPDPE